MIYKEPSIYKMGGGIKLETFTFYRLADDWQDITNDFICLNGNSWTQQNEFLYSPSLKLIYFKSGGTFKRASAYSGAAWQSGFKYTGNLFNSLNQITAVLYIGEKNNSLIYANSGVNNGLVLLNAVENNGITNGLAVIPSYFNDSNYDHTFVFKLFIPQTHTNTYGAQFNYLAYKITG